MNDTDDADQKRLALALFLDAWDAGLAQGVAAEIMATTGIFVALTDMVDRHGRDAVAQIVAPLAQRVRAGDFDPGPAKVD